VALEDKIRRELLDARKAAYGLTLSTMTTSPVLCAVLGDGNPVVALNALKAALLRDHDGSLALSAAAASLGFASKKQTHLGRLDEFGSEYDFDQRQVRRYSDKGVNSLASMISRHWANETAPYLTAVISRTDRDHLILDVQASQLVYVEMQAVSIVEIRNQQQAPADLSWQEECQAHWRHLRLDKRVIVPAESSVVLVFEWKGEMWPRFRSSIVGNGVAQVVSHESAGNKLQLELQNA
jgi:hypothetical protein